MKTLPYFFLFAVFFSLSCYSQRLPPLGTLPTYYNGGFAGEAGVPRVNIGAASTLSYGSDDYAVNSSYCASVDAFVPAIRTGIGFAGLYNNSSFNTVNSTLISQAPLPEEIRGNLNSVSCSLSPKISLNGRYTFAPFVDLKYTVWSTTYIFPDSTGIQNNSDSRSTWSGRAGILVNSRRFYAGLSLPVLRKDDDKDVAIFNSRDGVLISHLQLGYSFQKTPKSKFSFSPQLVLAFSKFKSNANIRLADASAMFRYGKLLVGGNRDGFAVGYQNKKLRLLLSQLPRSGRYIFFFTVRYLFKGPNSIYNL